MRSTIKHIAHLPLYLYAGAGYIVLWTAVETAQRPETFLPRLVNEIWREVYLVPVLYLLFEFTIQHLSRKKPFRSLALIILQTLLLSIGLYGWRELGVVLHLHTPFVTYDSFEKGIEAQMGAGVTAVVLFGMVRHFYLYNLLRQSEQRLRMEKQEAELNFLKSQTNPHFLFNTLNNIYSLARDKSDRAPESILRLSKILRYMLYETSGAVIPVENELKIIDDYLALETLRYDDSLRINFRYDVDDMKQSLPPLLLIPLVENAFKHGVSETRHRPFVDIHLVMKNRQLTFVVRNSADGSRGNDTVKENIGLSNVRRRLELLYSEYHLSAQQEPEQFTATLSVNLATHV